MSASIPQLRCHAADGASTCSDYYVTMLTAAPVAVGGRSLCAGCG